MMIEITLPDAYTDLNKYINAERTNRYKASSLKRNHTESIRRYAEKHRKTDNPCHMEFHWYCMNERKDPDNIAFQKKFILDGLVQAKTIVNDTWKYIKHFKDYFHVDKENPRIVIRIFDDTCIYCGCYVPEGTLVCKLCLEKYGGVL